jgi:seryl-tRNA synthetase
MNRFAWDLRYNDPTQIPGAFYFGTGPKGPLALPGNYQVKLTVGGKSETAPLYLAIDPRTKGAEAALQKQFTLSTQVNDRISQLHQAVNEIREVRSQIKNLHQRFGDDQRLKSALTAADDLDKKMSEVEQKLTQVNMKSSEGNLAFPSMLNERFDTFSHTIDRSDTEPTKPQLDVFQTLSTQLEEQLKKWAQLKAEDVPKVSELIKQANLPALIIGPAKKSE